MSDLYWIVLFNIILGDLCCVEVYKIFINDKICERCFIEILKYVFNVICLIICLFLIVIVL